MLLPNGQHCRVFWAPHEELWVRAANSFALRERERAFADIAGLTGRSYSSVRSKAIYLRRADREAARKLLMECLGQPSTRLLEDANALIK